MVLPGILILPSASTINGTSDVFSVLVWFTIAANHSSSCTDELLPVRGIVLGFADIRESEYFPSASSSFNKKFVTAWYGFDNWEPKFFPSAFPSCKEELVVSPGSRTAWHRENIWESEFFPSASSSCKEELLLIVGASTAWHREKPKRPFPRSMLIVLSFFWIRGLCILGFLYTNLHKDRYGWRYGFEPDLAKLEAEEHRRDSLQPLLCPASLRFSTNNDLPGLLSRAGRSEILPHGIGLTLAYLHAYWSTHVIHRDIKLCNILLDSDYQKGTLHHGGDLTHVQKYFTRVPKYLSIQHRLIQVMLLDRNKFALLSACNGMPKSIVDVAKRLCSSVLPNWCKADWNSASSMSESPNKAGTVSEFNTRKSTSKRNMFTENESHLSDTDLSRAEHGIKETKAKTVADWIAATGAPHHATGNRDLLSGFVIEHDDQFVHAVDGVPRKVLARGAVITDAVVLPDVWYVPGLTENLVSVSQLAELDHSIGFGRGECCIRSVRDAKIVGKGRLQKRGHYVLDYLKVPLAI